MPQRQVSNHALEVLNWLKASPPAPELAIPDGTAPLIDILSKNKQWNKNDWIAIFDELDNRRAIQAQCFSNALHFDSISTLYGEWYSPIRVESLPDWNELIQAASSAHSQTRFVIGITKRCRKRRPMRRRSVDLYRELIGIQKLPIPLNMARLISPRIRFTRWGRSMLSVVASKASLGTKPKKPPKKRVRTARETPSDKMDVAYDYHVAGKSFRAIGTLFNVSHETARKWVKFVKGYRHRNRSATARKRLLDD